MSPDAEKIAALNDACRRAGPLNKAWFFTPGVLDRGEAFMARAAEAVMAFNTFRRGDDPHGEHDFGSVTVDGHKLFWKIDYYDLSLQYGSADATDPAVTRRVLTVMLAEEY